MPSRRFELLTDQQIAAAPAWTERCDLLPDRWRGETTRAAALWLEDQMLAVGRIYTSRVHDSRFWTELTVAPAVRGRGFGKAMVYHLANLRPEYKPLCTRGYSSSATVAFARHLGALPYQTCPPETVQTIDAVNLSAADVLSRPGDQVDSAELKQAWVDTYAWTHAAWSPVAPGFEMPLLNGFEDDLDRHHTRVIATPAIRAAAFVFFDDPLPVIVAECRTVDEPDGLSLLRTCIRDSLTSLNQAGIHQATFDGHDTDPHFRPILDELPTTGETFELLEWQPAAG